MKNLFDALIKQLKDLYSAEIQIVESLPQVIKGSFNEDLKKAFSRHLEETNTQIARLEKISKALEIKFDGHTCQAMKGLIKECTETLSDTYKVKELKDVMLVAAAQRIEHYEIAGYGNAIALADFLGFKNIASTLQETIEEEGNADKKLTSICEDSLYEACSTKPDTEEALTQQDLFLEF